MSLVLVLIFGLVEVLATFDQSLLCCDLVRGIVAGAVAAPTVIARVSAITVSTTNAGIAAA